MLPIAPSSTGWVAWIRTKIIGTKIRGVADYPTTQRCQPQESNLLPSAFQTDAHPHGLDWREPFHWTSETKSQRGESNPANPAYKAGALPRVLRWRSHASGMERVTGIEPASPAWKAGTLAIELHPQEKSRDGGTRTPDNCIPNAVAWPLAHIP